MVLLDRLQKLATELGFDFREQNGVQKNSGKSKASYTTGIVFGARTSFVVRFNLCSDFVAYW